MDSVSGLWFQSLAPLFDLIPGWEYILWELCVWIFALNIGGNIARKYTCLIGGGLLAAFLFTGCNVCDERKCNIRGALALIKRAIGRNQA